MAKLTRYNGKLTRNGSGQLTRYEPSIVVPDTIKYGLLYNWWATQEQGTGVWLVGDDMRSEGWGVPTDAQWATLSNYLGGDTVSGWKLKEEGFVYWNSPNSGTNDVGFNARGSGRRRVDGSYGEIKSVAWFNNRYIFQNSQDLRAWVQSGTPTLGVSIRLIRPATTAEQLLPDGELSGVYYYGNDGKVYRVTKIYTQVWVADNLAETKWSDGYTDWYLPSKDELNAMYVNLHSEGVGEFADRQYWTSSEHSTNNNFARLQDFSNGNVAFEDKTITQFIRPIRDFISTDLYALKDFEGGGWIFHIEDLGEGSYKYYVAASSNAPTTLMWGASGIITGATGTAIGTGKANTASIIATLDSIPEIEKAAQYCDNYDSQWIQGYDGGTYTPITDANWAALTTAALCAYDNQLDNAYPL